MKKSALTFLIILFTQLVQSQSVGIGISTPDGSALLDLQSTSKGFLLPRMTSTQRNAIPSPAAGLMIFDTDKGAIYMFDGEEWLPLAVSKNGLYTQTRTPADPAALTGFGWQSCLSGNFAAISSSKGAVLNISTVVDTVYIYEKVGGSWTFRTKLTQSDAMPGDGFGSAIGLAGDYLLVGAPYRNNQAGAVYAFSRSGQNWTQTAILTPFAPLSGSRFGASISIGGAYALIGAPNYSSNGVSKGTVYSFSRNISSWVQTQQLWGISSLEGFGETIDVSGTYALVGAPGSDYNGVSQSGIAYFFKRNGAIWSPSDTVYNPDPEEGNLFGYAVAISESNDWAFISRPDRFTWNTNTGDVVVYHVDNPGLTQRGTLMFPNRQTQTAHKFGASLSVYDNHLAIGVPGATNEEGSKGRVYIFRYDQSFTDINKRWQPWKVIKDESIIPSDNYFDTYGLSVFVNGADIIMGNPGANNFRGKVLFMNIY
jgi:hypothetical protein